MKRTLQMVWMLAAVAATMTMVACQKENTNEAEITGKTDGKKIVKETSIYYSYHGDAYATGERYSYGHVAGGKYVWKDNQLVDVHLISYRNGAMEETAGVLQLIYDGGVPTSVIYGDEDTMSLTYSNGRLTKITTTYNIEELSYSSDGRLEEVTETEPSGEYSSHSRITWEGNNIASICKISYYNGSKRYQTDYTYTYDNKKSAYTMLPEYLKYFSHDASTLSANNMLTEREVTVYEDEYLRDYNTEYTTTYTYTYEDDYPVKCVKIDNSTDDNSNIETTYFEYVDGTGRSQQVPSIYTLTVDVNNDNYGNAYGEGSYVAGDTAVLYAWAYMNCTFLHWNDGNTDNPRTITVNENASYTAYFSDNSQERKNSVRQAPTVENAPSQYQSAPLSVVDKWSAARRVWQLPIKRQLPVGNTK